MKKLWLALGLLLCLGLAPAQAQTKFTMPAPAGIFLGGYQVVTTCGTASGLASGNLAFGAMDTTGAICTNATGGTLTTNNGKLRTSFATTGVSDFRIASTATLTAGTRTLDAQPLASVEFAVSTAIDAGLLPTTDLFRPAIGESPLVLAQNEGFVLQATVPGTGTWVFSARVCWDEVSAF